MVTRIAYTSVALGIVMMIYSAALMVQRYNPARLRFASAPAAVTTGASNVRPVRIVVKPAGIDTPVATVPAFPNRWETSTSGASYLETSPVPGTKGNSIVYGHNWASIFLNLTKVKPGDFVEVYMNDGSRRVFGVTATQTVSPKDVEVLKSSNDQHLTLYTCTGFLDTKRFVVSATLQSELN